MIYSENKKGEFETDIIINGRKTESIVKWEVFFMSRISIKIYNSKTKTQYRSEQINVKSMSKIILMVSQYEGEGNVII